MFLDLNPSCAVFGEKPCLTQACLFTMLAVHKHVGRLLSTGSIAAAVTDSLKVKAIYAKTITGLQQGTKCNQQGL